MSDMTGHLRSIPLAELHVHLRGMLQPDVFMELIKKHGKSRPWLQGPPRHREMFNRYPNIAYFIQRSVWNDDAMESFFRFRTFDQFLATWCFTGYLIRDIDDFTLLVDGALGYLKSENIIYAEITVSPSEYLSSELSFPGLVELLDSASSQSPVHVQWIFDLVRDNGSEKTESLLNEIIGSRNDSIVGITLGGTEHRFPPAQFRHVYEKACRHGLRLTVHAGESLGPESIWDAVNILGVERIGHGVRAVDDPKLVSYLAERAVPLEICPTSNIRTGIYPSLKAHPVMRLYQSGIPITINSDDPVFFGTSLSGEYAHLMELGFTNDDIMHLILNSFRYSFLPEGQSAAYIRTVEERISELSRAHIREP